MDFHLHAEEDLTMPLLKSKGGEPFPQMESSKTRENSILEKSSFAFVDEELPRMEISKNRKNSILEKSSFTFVVKDYFSCCKGIGVGKKIESEQFTVGGHTWTIAFYPDGKDAHAHNGGRGYVSLYLCLKSQSSGGVDFVCSLSVLDQLHCKVAERRVYRHVSTLESGQSLWGFNKFMQRATIESRSYGFLKEDCIEIKADLGVFVEKSLPLPPNHDQYVFFKVGDKQLYAEKSVLAKRCPSLLYDAAIPEIERNVFEAMLWFIYKGELHWQDRKAISDSRSYDPNSFALQMLAAADYFHLKTLKRQCQSVILYDNPKVLVLYDKVVSNLKKPWSMACRLVTSKLMNI